MQDITHMENIDIGGGFNFMLHEFLINYCGVYITYVSSAGMLLSSWGYAISRKWERCSRDIMGIVPY